MQRLIRPVAIAVVAAAVGYALARSADSGSHSSQPKLDRTGQTSAFSLRYPSDWHGGDPPALSGLALHDELTLGPTTDERLAVGEVGAAALGALPAGFLSSLSRRPRPETVALGPYRFDRYLDLRPREIPGAVSVYLLATTRSTVVATCSARRPRSAFVGDCERVLATLRLSHGAKAYGGVDTAYALGLNAVLSKLNPVRRSAGPGLRSADIATRARSARRLAAAERHAADAAKRLRAGNARASNRMLVDSLRSAAGGYDALATAALKRDTEGYEDAQRTLSRAQSTLTTAFQQLAELGYRLR